MHLPTMADIRAAGPSAEYGPLPPFGYLFNVLTGLFFHGDNFRLASRFGTLLAGYPTVVFAYALGRELFRSRFLAFMLPLLVVVHPQLIFTQSYTNNDGLATTLCSACIYVAVVGLKRGTSTSRAVLLGFLIGWAALAKTNSLSLIPALLFALWSSSWLRGGSVSQFLKLAIALVGTLGLTTGWYYIRNYFAYSGDCLGSRTMIAMWQTILPHAHGKPIFPWPGLTTMAWWRYVFFDFWGLFGFMNRYLWRPLYLVFFGLGLAAVAGWIRSSPSSPSNQSSPSSPSRQSSLSSQSSPEIPTSTAPPQIPAVPDVPPIAAISAMARSSVSVWQFLAACTLLNLIAVVYVTLSGVSGPHGRYLFTSELAILALILAGFARCGKQAERILSCALVTCCLVSTAYGWLVYYGGRSWR